MNLNFTLILQIASFIILMGFLTRFLYKPIIKILDERKDSVAKMLRDAQASQETAKKYAEQTRHDLDMVNNKALQIKEEARRVSDAERLKIIKEAKEQALALIEEAKAQGRKELEAVKSELKRQIADISMEAAKRILARELTQKDHKRLIDECIKELGA